MAGAKKKAQVYHLDDYRPVTVGWEQLADEVKDPARLRRIARVIHELADDDKVAGIHSLRAHKIKLLRANDISKWGVLYSHQHADLTTVNENFPRALVRENVPRAMALAVVASNTVAYAAVKEWRKSLPARIEDALAECAEESGMGPSFPHIWEDRSYNTRLGIQYPDMADNRLAAAIALEAEGLTGEFEFMPWADQPPYPNHIAALADGFSLVQASRLIRAADAAL